MSLFSSFFILLLVLIEASPTSASVSYLGEYVFRIAIDLCVYLIFLIDMRYKSFAIFVLYIDQFDVSSVLKLTDAMKIHTVPLCIIVLAYLKIA